MNERTIFKLDIAFTTIKQEKGDGTTPGKLMIRYRFASQNSRLFEELGNPPGPIQIASRADLERVFQLFDPMEIFTVGFIINALTSLLMTNGIVLCFSSLKNFDLIVTNSSGLSSF